MQGLPQRNLHHSILWKEASARMLFYKPENGCRLGEKCSYEHRQVMWTEQLSHVTFSRVSQHTFQCRTWHWLKVSCAHVIHLSSACCCCLDTLRPSTLYSSSSLSSSVFFLLIFIFIFHVGWFDEKSHAHFRERGVRHFGQGPVLAWLGDQLRHHRQSALFTTVHSGARRTSEP